MKVQTVTAEICSTCHQLPRQQFCISLPLPDWKKRKNTCYAEYVQHSMTGSRIWGFGRNMACAEFSASGLWNSWHTRESQCTSVVKLTQEGQQNGQASQKVNKIRKVGKKVNRIRKVGKKMSTKLFI